MMTKEEKHPVLDLDPVELEVGVAIVLGVEVQVGIAIGLGVGVRVGRRIMGLVAERALNE